MSAAVGQNISLQIPIDTFLDRQPDGSMSSDLLSYSIHHSLPWLHFDQLHRVVYGEPQRAGIWSIVITATDPGFREGLDPPMDTSTEFLLHVRETIIDPNAADFWASSI